MKIVQFLLRVMITPLLIMLVMVPAFLTGLIVNQFTFIFFILISGIGGQAIEYQVQQHQKKKNGVKESKTEEKPENATGLESLPPEVQDLIREGESLKEQ